MAPINSKADILRRIFQRKTNKKLLKTDPANRSSLHTRIKYKKLNVELQCSHPSCGYTTYRHLQLQTHLELQHLCRQCGSSENDLQSHECPQEGHGPVAVHGPNPGDIDTFTFKEKTVTHGGVLHEFSYTPEIKTCMISELFDGVKLQLRKLLRQLVQFYGGIRIKSVVSLDLYEQGHNVVKQNVDIDSLWSSILHKNFIDRAVFTSVSYIIEKLNLYSETKSSWTVLNCNTLEVHVGELNLSRGRAFIPLPKELKNKFGLVSIRNKDSLCFHYCILAAVHEDSIVNEYLSKLRHKGKLPKFGTSLYLNSIKQHLCGPRQYKQLLKTNKTINFHGILSEHNSAGVAIESICEFEERNPNISVSVYGNSGTSIVPFRNTKTVRDKHISLLLVSENGKSHYVWIRDLRKLLGQEGKQAHYFCQQCYRPFVLKGVYEEHLLLCGSGNSPLQVYKAPRDPIYSFTSFEETLRIPSTLYFMFYECLKTPQHSSQVAATEYDPPIAYSIVLSTPTGYRNLEYYNGTDCISHFLKRALKIAEEVTKEVSATNLPVSATKAQLCTWKKASHCSMCWLPFTAADPKILHHIHYTGKIGYIGYSADPNEDIKNCGALHQSCNLKVKVPHYLNAVSIFTTPAILKRIQLEGFKNNIIFKSEPKFRKDGANVLGMKVNLILRINDFRNFKPDDTLESLTEKTYGDGGEFKCLTNFFGGDKALVSYILQNFPSFPVNYSVDSVHSLPPCSFNSPSDYCTYICIKGKLLVNTPKEYIQLIMYIRSLSLAGVVEHFRDYQIKDTGLDPSYSWTLATFAKHCAFFKNRCQVQYITCPVQRQLVDNLVRGGVTVINKKYFSPNSRYSKYYDPLLPSSEILNIDLTLSYGSICLKRLPVGDFELMTAEELAQFDFMSIKDDDEVGYIFECTLTLPHELHKKYRSLPLWPHKRVVSIEESGTKLKSTQIIGKVIQQERLLLTMYPKNNEVFYGVCLKFLLLMGFKLEKVSQGLRFRQEPFLKEYVEDHIRKRSECSSQLKREEHKLLINTVTGKFLVNNLKYPLYEYCTSATRARELLKRDKFEDVMQLGPNLSLFKFKRESGVDYNLRIISAVILDLSKLELYNCYYNKLKPIFGDDMDLILSNTDSLIVSIKNTDATYFNKLNKISDSFDFSNLPNSHPLYPKDILSYENQGAAGKWKIVHEKIQEFVGNRVNNYSLKLENDTDEPTYKSAGARIHMSLHATRHNELTKAIFSEKGSENIIQSVYMGDDNSLSVKVCKMKTVSADISRIWISPTFSLPFGYKGVNSIFSGKSNFNKFIGRASLL